MSTNLSTDQINAFREEGYLIVPGLFDAEEARILHAAAKADQAFEDHAYDLEDGGGGKAREHDLVVGACGCTRRRCTEQGQAAAAREMPPATTNMNVLQWAPRKHRA